jgi:SAM-dependent methyltransferase
MPKEPRRDSSNKSQAGQGLSDILGDRSSVTPAKIAEVALRFNREYRRDPFELPSEVEAMPIYSEWRSGALAGRIASPFWNLAKPQKGQRCLDIGCGVSFLIYSWRDWDAFFYGQDISVIAQETLNARGSQLNSKLFKGVQLGGAHELKYDAGQFDLAIATGFSCYYPLTYWADVMQEAKRVLKPGGIFVFDVIDPDSPIAENWAILETYLGAEVFLESLANWQKLIQASGAQVVKKLSGELFQLYKVKFG